MAPDDSSNSHRELMRLAIEEAQRAKGSTHPNPMVGCVILRDGEIAATGYHAGPGRAHAEVDALEALDGSAEGCDVYVNLEPCCHHGRTAPCTDALLEAGVDRVFVGVIDPDPRVSGEGVRRLEERGVEVVEGVLEEESRRVNKAYFKYMTEGLPWVSAKFAMTLDGKIATRTGDAAWVTGERARRRVHELRDFYDGIMVGTGTLKSDNPRLTARIEGGRDPKRIVLDTRLAASLDSNVYLGDVDDEESIPETFVAVGREAVDDPEIARRAETLRERGVEVLEIETDANGLLSLDPLLESVADSGIVRLFVEGGGRLIGSMFDAGHIDRVYAFVAPKLVGGGDAPGPNDGAGVAAMADAMELVEPTFERIGADFLISGDLRRSEPSES
mgnify:CR=1 FL=1